MERPLKKFFGYSAFLPLQKEVIVQILRGRDCLVLMAASGGKSICYQLPPLITKKTAVVISPLISLMQDQVASLQKRGIRAEYMGSAQKDGTVQGRAEDGEIDVLYMTPEKACYVSRSFWTALLRKGVSLLAVDEAHCISEWGHEFRPEYRKLCWVRLCLPRVPVVALTATATHKVREDIVQSLQLQNAYTAVSSFDRPNIFYGAKCLCKRPSAFVEELAKEVGDDVGGQGSTIIYCTTIKDVEKVLEALQNLELVARAYHAMMTHKMRSEVHRAFIADELQIVVATIAFGMGIDKPNVRRVIHYGCPKSLEAYYQESGRCGRDGRPSQCWLYYTRSEFMKGINLPTTAAASPNARRNAAVREAYSIVQSYCSTAACRRSTILEYFGEALTSENCGNCDNCVRPESSQFCNFAEEARLLMTAVISCGQKFGFRLPIDVLRGSLARKVLQNRFNSLPVHGQGRQKSVNWWWLLGNQLLAHGYFKGVFRNSFRLIRVTAKGDQFLQSATQRLTFPTSHEMAEEERKQRTRATPRVNCRQGRAPKFEMMVETTTTTPGISTGLPAMVPKNEMVLETAELATLVTSSVVPRKKRTTLKPRLMNASRLDFSKLPSSMQAKIRKAKCGWVEKVLVGSEKHGERVRKCSMVQGKSEYHEVYREAEYEALVVEAHFFCRRPKCRGIDCKFYCKFCGEDFRRKNGLSIHRLMGRCSQHAGPLKMYPTLDATELARIARKHRNWVQSTSFKTSEAPDQKCNKRRVVEAAAMPVPKRQRLYKQKNDVDQSMENLDHSSVSGNGAGPTCNNSRGATHTQAIRSKEEANHVKAAPHRVPKNALYILCSETREIIRPELLKSASALMVTLHELEIKDELYERIGRAYGMWLLAAPVERPRSEPELRQVKKMVDSFRKQASGASNVVARTSELLQLREYLEIVCRFP